MQLRPRTCGGALRMTLAPRGRAAASYHCWHLCDRGQLRPQHPERDGPVELQVIGEEDMGHAAPADLAVHAIPVGEGCLEAVEEVGRQSASGLLRKCDRRESTRSARERIGASASADAEINPHGLPHRILSSPDLLAESRTYATRRTTAHSQRPLARLGIAWFCLLLRAVPPQKRHSGETGPLWPVPSGAVLGSVLLTKLEFDTQDRSADSDHGITIRGELSPCRVMSPADSFLKVHRPLWVRSRGPEVQDGQRQLPADRLATRRLRETARGNGLQGIRGDAREALIDAGAAACGRTVGEFTLACS
jgi:hypothetical protein